MKVINVSILILLLSTICLATPASMPVYSINIISQNSPTTLNITCFGETFPECHIFNFGNQNISIDNIKINNTYSTSHFKMIPKNSSILMSYIPSFCGSYSALSQSNKTVRCTYDVEYQNETLLEFTADVAYLGTYPKGGPSVGNRLTGFDYFMFTLLAVLVILLGFSIKKSKKKKLSVKNFFMPTWVKLFIVLILVTIILYLMFSSVCTAGGGCSWQTGIMNIVLPFLIPVSFATHNFVGLVIDIAWWYVIACAIGTLIDRLKK